MFGYFLRGEGRAHERDPKALSDGLFHPVLEGRTVLHHEVLVGHWCFSLLSCIVVEQCGRTPREVRESSALEQCPEQKHLSVEARGRLGGLHTHLPGPNFKQT